MRPVLSLGLMVLLIAPVHAGPRVVVHQKSLFDLHSVDLGSAGSFESPDRSDADSQGLMLAPPPPPTPTAPKIALPSFQFGSVHAGIQGSDNHEHFGAGTPGTKDIWGPSVEGNHGARFVFTLPTH